MRYNLLSVAVLAAAACTSQPPQSAPIASSAITEASVRDFLSRLADDSMEGRRTGTRGANKAAAFIASEMKAIGLVPLGDSAYYQKVAFAKTTGRRSLRLLDSLGALNGIPADQRVISYNVIGMIPGSDPAMKDQVVVIAAHYDAIGIVAPVNGDSIVNGA